MYVKEIGKEVVYQFQEMEGKEPSGTPFGPFDSFEKAICAFMRTIRMFVGKSFTLRRDGREIMWIDVSSTPDSPETNARIEMRFSSFETFF